MRATTAQSDRILTVDREPDGGSRVRIETRWHTHGPQGLIERLFAPRMLRRAYEAELNLLDRYARADVPDTRPGVHAGRGLMTLA